jgi:hypothetical protein
MADANISTLLPQIQPDLPGCPAGMVLRELRRAANEFCRDTGAWTKELTAIHTVVDQTDYAVTLTESAYVLRVTGVEIDDEALTSDQYTFDNGTLTLLWAPTEAGLDIVITAVLVPDLTNDLLPSALLVEWGLAIAHLATANLKAQPTSATKPAPWFDPGGAQVAASRYHDLMIAAKSIAMFGRTTVGHAWANPRFPA